MERNGPVPRAIPLGRKEIAGRLGIEANDMSHVMGELQTVSATFQHRERIAGMRGPGVATYFVNPLVGTHLAGAERDAAQAKAPPKPLLRVMQGGKAGREDTPERRGG